MHLRPILGTVSFMNNPFKLGMNHQQLSFSCLLDAIAWRSDYRLVHTLDACYKRSLPNYPKTGLVLAKTDREKKCAVCASPGCWVRRSLRFDSDAGARTAKELHNLTKNEREFGRAVRNTSNVKVWPHMTIIGVIARLFRRRVSWWVT